MAWPNSKSDYNALLLLFQFSIFFQESDGEKSDQDLVVDIANDTVSSLIGKWNWLVIRY